MLDEVVFRTLEKEREKRFQSADEVKAGVAGACDSPAASKRPASASGRNLVPWSIGLLLGGGTVLGVAGVAESLPLAAPGACAMVLGIASGWWTLWRMKQGTIAKCGRSLLLTTAVWIPVLSFGGVMAMLHMDEAMRPFDGKGDVFANLASVFGFAFAFALVAFQTFSLAGAAGLRSASHKIAASLTTVTLVVGALAVAKHKDGRWPAANFLLEISVYLPEPPDWTEEAGRLPSPVDRALTDAAGRYDGRIRTSSDGPTRTISLMAADHLALRAHWQAYSERLFSLLPEETTAQRPELQRELQTIANQRIKDAVSYRKGQEIDLTTLLLGAAAGIAAAYCLLPQALYLALGSFSVGVALALMPVRHVRGSLDEMLLPEAALPRLETKDPTFGSSTPGTPQSAVESLLAAARDRDEDSFLSGLSRSFASNVRKETTGKLYLGDFTEVLYTRTRQIDSTKANVVVHLDDQEREVVFEMIVEDGQWRLNDIVR